MGEIRDAEGKLVGGTPILAFFKGQVVEWHAVRNDPEFIAETAEREKRSAENIANLDLARLTIQGEEA